MNIKIQGYFGKGYVNPKKEEAEEGKGGYGRKPRGGRPKTTTSDMGKLREETEEKFDKLELRNRTVTETMSLVKDFGKNQESEDKEEEPEAKKQKFDTLSLRNRDVTETLSPLDN